MAKGLDELLQFLVNQIALDGERGAAPADISRYASHFYTKGEVVSVSLEDDSLKPLDRQLLQQVWVWLLAHPDISINSEDEAVLKWTLDEVEFHNKNNNNEESAVNTDDDHQLETKRVAGFAPDHEIRLLASEERQWHALAGHGPDRKRIAALEFTCLSIIGSRRNAGIAQPLLVRLTGQDKRSLPERTSRLAEKGYIVKRKVLWQGCATSLCILQQFATQELPSGSQVEQYEGSWVLHRFSKYETMIREALDIIENRNLIAWTDMRLLLDIPSGQAVGKRILEALKRFEFLGCLERVRTIDSKSPFRHARKDGYRSFRFIRPVTSQDWAAFFNLGRERPMWDPTQQQEQGTRPVESAAPDASDTESEYSHGEEAEKGSESPLWSPDRPIANTCYNVIAQAGPEGLITADACKFATGLFFRRPTATLLQEASNTWLANRPLSLALVRDAAQFGKRTVYKYYTSDAFQTVADRSISSWQDVGRPHPDLHQLKDSTSFPDIPQEVFHASSGLATLSEVSRATPGNAECRRSQSVISSLKSRREPAMMSKPHTNLSTEIRPDLIHNRGLRQRKYSTKYTEADLQAMSVAKRKQILNSISVGRRYHAKKLEERIQLQVANGASWLDAAEKLRLELENLILTYENETLCVKVDVLRQIIREHRDSLYLPSKAAHSTPFIVKPKLGQALPQSKRSKSKPASAHLPATESSSTPRQFRLREQKLVPPAQSESLDVSWTSLEPGRSIVLRSGRQSWPTAKILDGDTSSTTTSVPQPDVRPFAALTATPLSLTYDQQYAALEISSSGLHVGRPVRLKTSVRGRGPRSLLLVFKTPKLRWLARIASGLDSNYQGDLRDHAAEVEEQNAVLFSKSRNEARIDKSLVNQATNISTQRLHECNDKDRKRKRSTIEGIETKKKSLRLSGSQELAITRDEVASSNDVSKGHHAIVQNNGPVAESPNHQRAAVTRQARRSSYPFATEGYEVSATTAKTIQGMASPAAEIAPSRSAPAPPQGGGSGGSNHEITTRGVKATTDRTTTSSIVPRASRRSTSLQVTRAPRSSSVGAADASAPHTQPSDQQVAAKVGKVFRHGGSITAVKEKIVLDILNRCGGAFPGDREIWYPFSAEWVKRPGGFKPDVRTVNALVAKLEKEGKLRKVGFNFKTQAGLVKIKHILLLPEVSESGEAAESMRRRMIENHPKLFIPDEADIAERFKHHPEAWWTPGQGKYSWPAKVVESANPAMSRQLSKDITPATAPTPTERLRNWQDRLVALQESQRLREEKAGEERANPRRHPRKGSFNSSEKHRSSATERGKASFPAKQKKTLTQPATQGESQDAARQRRIDTVQQLTLLHQKSIADQGKSKSIPPGQLLPRASTSDGPLMSSMHDSSNTAARGSFINYIDPTIVGLNTFEGLARTSHAGHSSDRNQVRSDGLTVVFEEFYGPQAGFRPAAARPDREVDGEQAFFSATGCFGTFLEVPTWFVPSSLDQLLKRDVEGRRSRASKSHSTDGELTRMLSAIQKWEQTDACARNVKTDKLPFINVYPFGRAIHSASAEIKPRLVDRLQGNTVTRKRGRNTAAMLDERPLKRQRPVRRRGTGLEDDRSIMLACLMTKRLFQAGLESYTDWDVVCRLLSNRFTVEDVRRRWQTLRAPWKPWTQQVASAFDEKFLAAYEMSLVPEIDYQDLDANDWAGLMAWVEDAFRPVHSMEAETSSNVIELPSSRALLDRSFSVLEERAQIEDPFEIRRKEAKLSSKREWIHHINFAVMENQLEKQELDLSINDGAVARSWVKANSLTPSEEYRAPEAYQKLLSARSLNLELAAKQLVDDKILTGNHRGPGRPYDVSERFLLNLRVNMGPRIFMQAIQWKRSIDHEFESNGTAKIDFVVKEGSILALINLVAAGELSLRSANIKADAMGILGGSYKSRSATEDHLSFELFIKPTAQYKRGVNSEKPVAKPGAQRYTDETGADKTPIPAWITIHDSEIDATWRLAVCSVLSILALRPGLSCSGLTEYVAPSLEVWEIRLILEWAVTANIAMWVDEKMTGVMLKGQWWMALS